MNQPNIDDVILVDENDNELGIISREKAHRFESQTEPEDLAKDEVKSVFWTDPKIIYEEMRNDPGNHKFCGGFKASLKFYLEKKKLI